MKIINLDNITGPNEWSSIYTNLAVLDVHVPEQEMPGDRERSIWLNELESRLPSLIDYESGGLKKSPVSDGHGALIALLVELVSCELQALAGIDSMFGDVQKLGNNSEYRIVISCERKETGFYALQSAFEIVQSIVNNKSVDLSRYIEQLILLHHTAGRLETAA